MSSRERFEAWCDKTGRHYLIKAPSAFALWQARDAEVQKLVDALRYAVSIIGHPDDDGTKMLVALLREYGPEDTP